MALGNRGILERPFLGSRIIEHGGRRQLVGKGVDSVHPGLLLLGVWLPARLARRTLQRHVRLPQNRDPAARLPILLLLRPRLDLGMSARWLENRGNVGQARRGLRLLLGRHRTGFGRERPCVSAVRGRRDALVARRGPRDEGVAVGLRRRRLPGRRLQGSGHAGSVELGRRLPGRQLCAHLEVLRLSNADLSENLHRLVPGCVGSRHVRGSERLVVRSCRLPSAHRLGERV